MVKPTAAPVLEMEMEPKSDPATLPATQASGDPFLNLIERLSLDERIDPVKLRDIFDLKRGLEADRAKEEYMVAFAAMSEELPVISKDGHIKNRDGKVQSRYAKYENIQRVVKPILRKYGFVMNHEQNPETSAEMVLATFLIHRGGHSQRSIFRAKTDTSGSKNDVQGLGSIASYAKRYNTIALLDLQLEGDDDDGQKAVQIALPAGFTEWLDEMRNAAMDGTAVLTAKWQASKPAYQGAILAKDWESLKAGARAADKAAGRA